MAGLTSVLVYVLLLQSGCLLPLEGAKILLLPFQWTSTIRQAFRVGDGLIEQGHQAFVVVHPAMMSSVPQTSKVSVLSHHTPYNDLHATGEGSDSGEYVTENADIPMNMVPKIMPALFGLCRNLVSDTVLEEKLRAISLDLAIVDGYTSTLCNAVLPFKLNVPFCICAADVEPGLHRLPMLPSAWPYQTGPAYTPEMSFFQRLYNTWKIFRWSTQPFPTLEGDLIKEFMPEKPPLAVRDLGKKSLMTFALNDVLLDYPRPVMPNEIQVGGLMTSPASPLEPALQKFLDSAKEGAIIMSFGSEALDLNYETFITAFKQIKQKVVWRFLGDIPENLPPNVKAMKWIPQNDLLDHPNTKILITHCGSNSQYEALYHGIPMIGFPLFYDQHYNSARVLYHGYGIKLDILTFEADDLVKAINHVLTNTSYALKIQHASKVFRDSPTTPLERMLDGVEHVLKYGGQHMHPYALDMPIYQYLMLDIFGFTLALSAILLIFTYSCVNLLAHK